MGFVSVVEHRVLPEGAGAYLEAVGAVSRVVGAATGRRALTVLFADDDPGRALQLSHWDRPEQREAAVAALPAAVRGGIVATVDAGDVHPRWYAETHYLERMLERGDYAVAVRFRVAPEHVGAVVDWQVEAARRGFRETPSLVRLGLYRSTTEPTGLMALMHQRGRGGRRLVDAFLTQNPPPHRLFDLERFAGRIDLRWGRTEVGTGT